MIVQICYYFQKTLGTFPFDNVQIQFLGLSPSSFCSSGVYALLSARSLPAHLSRREERLVTLGWSYPRGRPRRVCSLCNLSNFFDKFSVLLAPILVPIPKPTCQCPQDNSAQVSDILCPVGSSHGEISLQTHHDDGISRTGNYFHRQLVNSQGCTICKIQTGNTKCIVHTHQ